VPLATSATGRENLAITLAAYVGPPCMPRRARSSAGCGSSHTQPSRAAGSAASAQYRRRHTKRPNATRSLGQHDTSSSRCGTSGPGAIAIFCPEFACSHCSSYCNLRGAARVRTINFGGGLASLARGGAGARLRLGANTSCSQKSAPLFLSRENLQAIDSQL
jgi:hypothetical protein